MINRTIPSGNEELPVIGLGTWQTFDVTRDQYPGLSQVLEVMQKSSASLIDSSPMYGKSEEAIGDLTADLEGADEFFYATKVWTDGCEAGISQINDSFRKMRRKTIDLIQIHNLRDWQTHLPYLRELQQEGKVRYIGITHYTDSSHEELEKVLKSEKFDFVQFNYSIFSRHAERRLLKVAAELGVATIINRPFGEGSAFARVATKRLPEWAADMQIHSWSGFFLKYLLGDPAVTCIIPATSSVTHAIENFAAGSRIIPDASQRKKMIAYLNER